jgi:hypothetical protein
VTGPDARALGMWSYRNTLPTYYRAARLQRWAVAQRCSARQVRAVADVAEAQPQVAAAKPVVFPGPRRSVRDCPAWLKTAKLRWASAALPRGDRGPAGAPAARDRGAPRPPAADHAATHAPPPCPPMRRTNIEKSLLLKSIYEGDHSTVFVGVSKSQGHECIIKAFPRELVASRPDWRARVGRQLPPAARCRRGPPHLQPQAAQRPARGGAADAGARPPPPPTPHNPHAAAAGEDGVGASQLARAPAHHPALPRR